jgi:hypothetical protein
VARAIEALPSMWESYGFCARRAGLSEMELAARLE